MGKLLEPVIIAEFERHSGRIVQAPQPLLRHPINQFIMATPDGLVELDEGLECKATNCGKPRNLAKRARTSSSMSGSFSANRECTSPGYRLECGGARGRVQAQNLPRRAE